MTQKDRKMTSERTMYGWKMTVKAPSCPTDDPKELHAYHQMKETTFSFYGKIDLKEKRTSS